VRLLLRAALLLALWLSPGRAFAGAREIELGLEGFDYPTTETPLNRENVLGLDPNEGLLRAALGWKESLGGFKTVLRGYLERSVGGTGDETHFTLRQGYAQYWWGTGLGLRVGKQRIAWGSGFAWNPTNRVEPPKNPLNAGLEQEGSWTARMDVVPAAWVGIVLLAARGDTRVGDLPFGASVPQRNAGALRVRFLAKDTDLALVTSGGGGRPDLWGFDVGRDAGPVSLHAEAAFYRGSEIAPAREDRTFFRIATGALRAKGETTLSLEYFYNGEGYDDREMTAYLHGLDASFLRASDPRLSPEMRDQALERYLAGASIPYSGGLGLRRQYFFASWTRSGIRGVWSLTAQSVVGLSDGGVTLTPGVGYAPRGNLTFNLDGVLLFGPKDSEYRLAPVKGAVQARVKVLF
jgi:hypothetical protein